MPTRRKVVVPKSIVAAIGSFGLDREIIIALLATLYSTLPDLPRTERPADDDAYFKTRIVVRRLTSEHNFPMLVDDTTSPDHLVVSSIGYSMEDKT